jgi:hypothetical protein
MPPSGAASADLRADDIARFGLAIADLMPTSMGDVRCGRSGGVQHAVVVVDPLATWQVHRPMGRRAPSGLKCCVMSNALPT